MTDEEYEDQVYGCTRRGFDAAWAIFWLIVCGGFWAVLFWLIW